jgi:C1A family cysteine protease
MKKAVITGMLVLLFALPTCLKAQIIINKSFQTVNKKTNAWKPNLKSILGNDTILIDTKQKISGLSVSGNILFTGKKGFVRVVLKDIYENEFLIFETNSIFEDTKNVSFHEICEETALLKDIMPEQILVECTEAEVTIDEFQYSTDKDTQLKTDKQLHEEQLNVKINRINTVLAKKHITWGAGKTSLSELTYMGKKVLYGGKLPNLAGFDYYVSGIYVMQGYEPLQSKKSLRNSTTNLFVSEFDWRNRHGRNWTTSAKLQGCSDCWVFAAVGTTEAYTNLYYNQLLNMNLSEQDVLSCSNGGTCSGGNTGSALNYIKNTGVVDETCFEYAASNLPCSNKCSNPSERIKIGNYTYFSPSSETIDDLKKLIVKAPLTFGIDCWWHALGLVGFKTIQIGDTIFIKTDTESRWETITAGNPLIGTNAWILKNSHGTNWGTNGFGYVVTDWSEVYLTYSINGNIASLNYTDADIVCEDRDGDGYYFWGIGPKPAHCPSCAPNEPDGDDSNPNLGPMDEYGYCAPITPLVENITTSQTWNTNRTLCKNLVIQSGATLTITATVFMQAHKVTIQNGGKIILSGGTIDNGNIIAQSGSELTITNNGKIILGSYDNLDIQLGAVFNDVYGEISLKQ